MTPHRNAVPPFVHLLQPLFGATTIAPFSYHMTLFCGISYARRRGRWAGDGTGRFALKPLFAYSRSTPALFFWHALFVTCHCFLTPDLLL